MANIHLPLNSLTRLQRLRRGDAPRQWHPPRQSAHLGAHARPLHRSVQASYHSPHSAAPQRGAHCHASRAAAGRGLCDLNCIARELSSFPTYRLYLTLLYSIRHTLQSLIVEPVTEDPTASPTLPPSPQPSRMPSRSPSGRPTVSDKMIIESRTNDGRGAGRILNQNNTTIDHPEPDAKRTPLDTANGERRIVRVVRRRHPPCHSPPDLVRCHAHAQHRTPRPRGRRRRRRSRRRRPPRPRAGLPHAVPRGLLRAPRRVPPLARRYVELVYIYVCVVCVGGDRFRLCC